jgi:crotonobetainyl-CoA:carnitine CoA-transferase CaiB-like acyl-CoA transferase
MAELVLSDHLGGHLFEPPTGDFGYNRALAPNRRPFRTLDGYVCVLLYTEKQWRTFFATVDQVERYEGDPRLSDPDTRRLDYDAAYGIVGEIIATRTTAEWLAALDVADIPVAPVSDVADLLVNEQLVEGTFWQHDEHPSEGAIRNVRRPATMSASGVPSLRPAPRLGEHTADVLREITGSS